jgi:3-dehydroquinate synthase
MRLTELLLESKLGDYKVTFTENTDFLEKYTKLLNVIFIVDENVWNAHAATSLAILNNSDVIKLKVNEERKTLDTVQELYDEIMSRSPKRNMTMISIGGGITQDITGFVASTLYRGINWIFVPTTLLAQSDSCIGSKTSLNYKKYKNLIGTFFPPTQIYINTAFIATQNILDFYSGLGEIGKLHLMGGENTTQQLIADMDAVLNRNITELLTAIQQSLLIKKAYIESDEFDTGRRNMLNYGHCFGHALESATNFEIPHGQAVVIGMMLANAVARKRKLLQTDIFEFINENILIPILKTDINNTQIEFEKVIVAMGQDKKRTGSFLALIMLTDGYEMVKFNDLTEDEAREALVGFFGK